MLSLLEKRKTHVMSLGL